MSGMSMVVLQLYTTLVDAITLAGLYWAYALFSAAGVLHTAYFIRETSRQDIG